MTIVELLVVVLICAVMASLLMSALRDVRARSRAAKSLSNLRTHAQAFTAYAGDYGDRLPFFTKVGFSSTKLEGGGVIANDVSFFDAHRTWHIVLADPYYSVRAYSEVFFAPTDLISRRHTTYAYACVFIADPRYWEESTRGGSDQWRPTKLHEVLYPTAKALVVHAPELLPDGTYPVIRTYSAAFCDGSTREVPSSETINGYGLGDGYVLQNAGTIHYNDTPRLLHTINGVRGRDIR